MSVVPCLLIGELDAWAEPDVVGIMWGKNKIFVCQVMQPERDITVKRYLRNEHQGECIEQVRHSCPLPRLKNRACRIPTLSQRS